MECSAIVFSAYASSTNESLAVLTFIVLSCFARRDEITKERSGMAWYDLEQRRFGNFLERHLGRPAAGAFAAARLSIFLNLYGPRVIQYGSVSPAQQLGSLKCRCATVSVLIALDNFFSNAGTK